jgi:hypothetical protein
MSVTGFLRWLLSGESSISLVVMELPKTGRETGCLIDYTEQLYLRQFYQPRRIYYNKRKRSGWNGERTTSWTFESLKFGFISYDFYYNQILRNDER